MVREPLATLVKVRQLTLDSARRALGACLTAEREAARTLEVAERTFVSEVEQAARGLTDTPAELFPLWFRSAACKSRDDRSGHLRARAESVVALGAATFAWSGLTAAQAALAASLQKRRSAQFQAEQAALDELARGRVRPDRAG